MGSRQPGKASKRANREIKTNTIRRDNNNGGRPRTKFTGHLPQSRSKDQNATDDLSGQWSEAARNSHLVRQLLSVVAAGRPLPARLQACDLDHHAWGSDSV